MPISKRLELIEWLLKGHRSCLTRGNNHEATPLVVAAHFGMPQVIQRLLASSSLEVLVRQTTKSGAGAGCGWPVLEHVCSTLPAPYVHEVFLKGKEWANKS